MSARLPPLKSLDTGQHELLVRCSVLERLSGPLCDTVLGTTGSATVLEGLDRADLLVTALGDQWYRCHQLFRDALRRELVLIAPEQAQAVLGRAAEWFLARGHVEEAIAHRLAAGEEGVASQLHHARRAARLEDDPTRRGYVVAPQGLAGALWVAGSVRKSIAVLRDSRSAPVHRGLPALPMLQGTAQLALNLVDIGELAEARRLCAEVTEIADAAEQMWGVQHFVARQLQELGAEIGRKSSRTARHRRVLTEELTDRELSVLRAPRSTLSAREIGAELYLSINTVKSYKKSLYRKLGVVTREDAVCVGRELGLV